MKYIPQLFLLFLLFIFSCSRQIPQQADIVTVADNFVEPPRQARPYVWWHWMFGYVSQEGILKDLSWMDRTGIAGFHQFDAGGLGMAKAADVQYPYFSEGWKDMFRYALHVADSLGMDVTIASAPGWSSTGAPFVKPQDAMKKLEWRYVETDGGQVDIQFPPLYRTVGPFQDFEQLNDRIEVLPYGEDLAVLAVRLGNDDFSASGRVISDSLVTIDFDSPVTVRSVTTHSYRLGGRPYIGEASSSCILESSSDGLIWTPVKEIPVSRLPYVTENFEPVTAAHFRVRGVQLRGATLFGAHRIEHAEEKGAFTNPGDLHRFLTPDTDAPAQVIDLTDRMTEDGRLAAELPSGRWRIYRFGWSITGKVNHPANPEATGLEVDKLDPEAWTKYFRTYLDMYREAAGGKMGSEGIQRLLIDSYEAGSQTWTPRMEEQFTARRGYPLKEWLPVLAGEIIGSTEESEGFLWDWRKTISELYEENYERVDSICAEYGLKGCYIESHEGGRAFCGDGMRVKRKAEIPMSAIWVHDTPAGSPIPQAISDIKESASVAHLYGHPIVAAESFTAEGSHQKAYTYTPEKLRYTAHTALSSGLNRFVIHESAAQPGDSFLPGVGLFGYGQWFTRHETWAEWARPWTDYLSRSCYMLQQGQPVADILCYYGEDSNATAQFGGSSFGGLFQVPDGYEYDYIDPWSLLHTVQPSSRHLVTESGMSYTILALSSDCTTMSVEVLERLREFADAGVIICGSAPVHCAGRLGDRARFSGLVSDIWSGARRNVVATLSEAISASGLKCDFSVVIPGRSEDSSACNPSPGTSGFRYVHRTLSDADIWWIWNSSDSVRAADLDFRCCRRHAYLFDAEDGSITDWSDLLSIRGGRCSLPLPAEPGSASFIVLTDKELPQAKERKEFTTVWSEDIPGPWRVDFVQKGGATAHLDLDTLTSWTLSTDPVIRYYSGIAEYKTQFKMDSVGVSILQDSRRANRPLRESPPGSLGRTEPSGIRRTAVAVSFRRKDGKAERLPGFGVEPRETEQMAASPTKPESPIPDKSQIVIDLGEVRELAEVLVNGESAGILWHSPFVTGDISSLLHEGENTLTVRVANTWVNRMIGDKQPGVTEPVTRVVRFYKADDPLLPSGLLGPVKIVQQAESQE